MFCFHYMSNDLLRKGKRVPSSRLFFCLYFFLHFLPSISKLFLGHSVRNRTIFVKLLVYRSIEDFLAIAFLRMYYTYVIHFSAVILLWVCTILLATVLKRNIRSRETNFRQASKNVSQTQDRRVMKTVFILAALYLAFSTPRTITNGIHDLIPEFGIGYAYGKEYFISIVIGVQLSLLNSSINLFIYINTSYKFRDTVQSGSCVRSIKV